MKFNENILIPQRKPRAHEDNDCTSTSAPSSTADITSINLEENKPDEQASSSNVNLELIKQELRSEIEKELQKEWEITREKIEMVRVNFDLPFALHHYMKSHCIRNNTKVSDALRKIILKEFGRGHSMADMYKKSPKRKKI